MLMQPTEMLAEAIKIAATMHRYQYDKSGAPYILHPLKVAYKLKTDDFELMTIAVLHDIKEDTEISDSDLYFAGFSQRVINAVDNLTKRDGETYDSYKTRVKSSPDSIRVKMEDLRHNSDLRRLKGVTDKDIARAKKYMEFYQELKELL